MRLASVWQGAPGWAVGSGICRGLSDGRGASLRKLGASDDEWSCRWLPALVANDAADGSTSYSLSLQILH